MATDKDIEELVIEPIWIIHNLPNLQTRLEIKIIADVTSLKIEIDNADATLTRCLVSFEFNGRLECERCVTNATSARNEGNRNRLVAMRVADRLIILAPAAPCKNVDNLLRIGVN